MALQALDHFTIRVVPEQLAAVRRFYVEVLGLTEGERPGFSFPGHWLYLGGRPVVHLAGRAAEHLPQSAETGSIDHIAFSARGLERMRAHLQELGAEFREQPVPGPGPLSAVPDRPRRHPGRAELSGRGGERRGLVSSTPIAGASRRRWRGRPERPVHRGRAGAPASGRCSEAEGETGRK